MPITPVYLCLRQPRVYYQFSSGVQEDAENFALHVLNVSNRKYWLQHVRPTSTYGGSVAVAYLKEAPKYTVTFKGY